MDSYFQILGEAVVELLEVLLVLGQLGKQLQALLDHVLADDLENLALLQHLSGNVEGQIFRVHNTTDEVWRDNDWLLVRLKTFNRQDPRCLAAQLCLQCIQLL